MGNPDIDANGSWGNAVKLFEDQRPDMATPSAGMLTADGTCRSCQTKDVALFRTPTSLIPDTCTTCRGLVR